ncbi:putative cysteine-rich receptor-like protein [Vigna angularis]|uniref:Putative cysteine-rich receptor-like protein n=1 Tax=Phaseolus angularis TaxID=3914 RepID=A0A8T0KNV6_PHAAN|nr:putative cysteine-rich receptor-like protein [Vigna angularis]
MFGRNMFLSNSINHVTFLLFLSLFVIEPFCSSAAPVYNYCPTNASYNSTATFETNLKFLLESLVSNISQSDGSYFTAMGLGTTSAASGYFLCRGDVSLATCNDCITTAATEITQLCPNKTESIIWYDECTLRFTNTYFDPASIEPGASLWNGENISTSDLGSFNGTLFGLLDDLVEETANSNSARKFATGDREFAGSSAQRRVYALTECEPSLTSSSCEECLQNAISTLPSCCEGKEGARALLAWCNVRYELFQFYNTNATSPPSSAPHSCSLKSSNPNSQIFKSINSSLKFPLRVHPMLVLSCGKEVETMEEQSSSSLLLSPGAEENTKLGAGGDSKKANNGNSRVEILAMETTGMPPSEEVV